MVTAKATTRSNSLLTFTTSALGNFTYLIVHLTSIILHISPAFSSSNFQCYRFIYRCYTLPSILIKVSLYPRLQDLRFKICPFNRNVASQGTTAVSRKIFCQLLVEREELGSLAISSNRVKSFRFFSFSLLATSYCPLLRLFLHSFKNAEPS